MRIAGTVGGLLLAFVGAVWMLQGFNATFVPQSFMTASPLWILIGAVTLGGGLALARRSWNR
ncbi:MAG: hypothetical protein M3112_06135 [Actinomycetia bacterium]|nr:hypothetical protein [Actinomycetes bacterium]